MAGLKPAAVVLRDGENGRDFYDRVQDAAGREGVHVVADIVGGPLFQDCLALLREGGRYVCSGAIAGPVVPFDLRTMYLKYLRLIGVSIGYPRHFEAVLDHIAAGRVKPVLAETYPLSQIRAAQEKFMSKDFFGNIVVLPQEG